VLLVAVAIIAVTFVVSGGLTSIIRDKAEERTPVAAGFPETNEAAATVAAVTDAAAAADAVGEGSENAAPEADGEATLPLQEEDENDIAELPDSLPLAGAVIGIDAGHQLHGNNDQEAVAPDSSTKKPKVTSGTAGSATGIPEHELNLAVALKLQELLEEAGATVIMTRTTADVDISNQQRATMMNEAGADLVIRIHANGGNSSEKGAMMLVPDGHIPEDVEDESILAGEIIFENYLAETGAANLGVIPRSDMTGFNWSTVPVCLIEMGFMTNPEEDELLATDEYRDKCAAGLAKGIEEWYSGQNL
jgi:N-acetylmuramoyl-L-alanine amidase